MLTDTRVTRLTGLGALPVALLYAVSMSLGSLTSVPATDASGPPVVQFHSEHRAGLLARVVAVGALVAIVHAAISVSFARAGVLSPAGIGTLAAPAFALWLIAIVVALLRGPVTRKSVAPAAA
jgi:hypothetical protein